MTKDQNRIETIRISELPETAALSDSDLLVQENPSATHKFKLSALADFLRKHTFLTETFIKRTDRGQSDGVAPLDADKKLPPAHLDFGKNNGQVYEGSEGKALETSVNVHVLDNSNPHNVTKSQIGLSNVNNTSDLDKPVSTAQRKAIDLVCTDSNAYTDNQIAQWSASLNTVAFTGSYNDLSNKPAMPASVAVKGNEESIYRTGNVNLTPENIGALPLTGGEISNINDGECMRIHPFGIEGNGNQMLNNFDIISASNIYASAIYYDEEDLDNRYVMQNDAATINGDFTVHCDGSVPDPDLKVRNGRVDIIKADGGNSVGVFSKDKIRLESKAVKIMCEDTAAESAYDALEIAPDAISIGNNSRTPSPEIILKGSCLHVPQNIATSNDTRITTGRSTYLCSENADGYKVFMGVADDNVTMGTGNPSKTPQTGINIDDSGGTLKLFGENLAISKIEGFNPSIQINHYSYQGKERSYVKIRGGEGIYAEVLNCSSPASNGIIINGSLFLQNELNGNASVVNWGDATGEEKAWVTGRPLQQLLIELKRLAENN